MSLGRASAELCAKLREDILAGRRGSEGFLPSQRELSAEFGLAHTTVRRALKQLIEEGLLVAEPRRGFRVLPNATDPNKGCPVAYIPELYESGTQMQPWLLEELRRAAGRRGWSMLAPGIEDRAPGNVIAELKSQRCFGAVLNTVEPRILKAVEDWGVPAVVVNDLAESASVDSVIQDAHQGGIDAVRYLCGKGCKRIAYFSPRSRNAHALERFGGVSAALNILGPGLPDDLLVWTTRATASNQARELLSRTDRPDGIVCMWLEPGRAIGRTARELGLSLGKDLHLVGWCAGMQYEEEWLPAFEGGYVPPANTWTVETMAELALSRLAERRESPDTPALRVKVPTTLRVVE